MLGRPVYQQVRPSGHHLKSRAGRPLRTARGLPGLRIYL